jgi:hypothetical protein
MAALSSAMLSSSALHFPLSMSARPSHLPHALKPRGNPDFLTT